MRKARLIVCLFFSGFEAFPPILRPGFNGKEYMEVLSLCFQRYDAAVMLMPDANYFQKFPHETRNVFQHHLFAPDYDLAKQYYGDQ